MLHWRVSVPITLEKVCDCHVDRVEIGVEDLVFSETSFTYCKLLARKELFSGGMVGTAGLSYKVSLIEGQSKIIAVNYN